MARSSTRGSAPARSSAGAEPCLRSAQIHLNSLANWSFARDTRRSGDGSVATAQRGIAVASVTALAVLGHWLGISPWLIALAAGGSWWRITVDWVAFWWGAAGICWPEALQAGQARLRRRIASLRRPSLLCNCNDLPIPRV